MDEFLRQVDARASGKKETKAEAKKRRHRESMAKGRSRHNALMESMRKQYQQLSRRLENSLAWRRQKAAAQDAGAATESELLTQYLDAVETENNIHRENEALAQRLEQLEIFETTLRVDTPELQEHHLAQPSELPARTIQALNRPGFWSYFAEDTEPFYYEPMATDVCHGIVRDKYQAIKAHHANFLRRLRETNDAVQFFGWTVQRYLTESHKLQFHFMKQIPCADSAALAEELASEGWRVFNTPPLYMRCYRSPIDVRVLQRVDQFNTVLIRNSPDANRSHRFRHLNISSKVADEHEDGHRSLSILTVVVPPPDDLANANRNGVVYLRDAYTYIRFDMYDGYVELTYGGHGDCLNEAQARYLFVETGNVLFRFEQMVRRSNLVTLG